MKAESDIYSFMNPRPLPGLRLLSHLRTCVDPPNTHKSAGFNEVTAPLRANSLLELEKQTVETHNVDLQCHRVEHEGKA